jgi:hypothetical protein
MIEEQKVIGMLQAKALGCLDDDDENQLQDFINAGHVFPWDELGVYQNVASLLPLALPLDIPDVELKDKVALRLIKLRDEQRAKKLFEEEKTVIEEPSEIIEEEIDEKVEEFKSIDEPYVEPQIEIETDTTEIEENMSSPINMEDTSFNLDDIVLPGYDPLPETATEFNVLENIEAEKEFERNIDEPAIEIPEVQEIDVDEVFKEPQGTINNDSPDEIASENFSKTNLIQDTEEIDKQPDLTKKSVAEKIFKTIEQDFDSLKYHYEESERKLTRGLLISYIVIAVLFALLIFFFFKFSTDINEHEQEIKYLKKNYTSSLIDNKNISSTHRFSC